MVFHRLKQSGLDSLCCLIHDSQTDKKSFIADLRACYEQWIAQPHDGDTLAARRTQLAEALEAHQQRIEAFESTMAAAPESLGDSVRALLRRVVTLPAVPEAGLCDARAPAGAGRMGPPARSCAARASRDARALRSGQPGRASVRALVCATAGRRNVPMAAPSSFAGKPRHCSMRSTRCWTAPRA
ncbi:hypothetical protein ACTMU2_04865 [Cupriavidus basilensis]